MQIQVEFYGIPKHRAGVETVTVATESGSISLGEVITDLTGRFPALAEACFNGVGLREGFVANVDGQRFVNDPSFVIQSDSPLLIMSADAGG